MSRKSIKTGMKVFALVLTTGSLYNWHLYRGSDDPLTDSNSMYKLFYDILLSDHFDNCDCIVFMDAAFISIKLFRALPARGIFAVGPMNGQKPGKGGDDNS